LENIRSKIKESENPNLRLQCAFWRNKPIISKISKVEVSIRRSKRGNQKSKMKIKNKEEMSSQKKKQKQKKVHESEKKKILCKKAQNLKNLKTENPQI